MLPKGRMPLQTATQNPPAARQLWRMLESIRDGFFVCDRQWKMLFLNKEAERVAGRTADQLVGKNLWDEYPELVGTSIHTEYVKAMDTGKANRFVEYLPMADAWFETNLYPSEEGLTIYFRDITEQKKAETKLSQYAQQLESSNQDLEQFAEVVSHDLKAPLASIITSVWVCQENLGSKIDGESQEQLQHILNLAGRMRRMISAILDYSHLTLGESNLARVNLNEVVEEVKENLSAWVDENKVTIAHEELPTIPGDHGRMIVLFQNLIQNAIKYRSEASPRICLRAKPHRQGIMLFFHDNGCGIERKDLSKIFRMFGRVEGDLGEDHGTGIGLAICRKVALKAGGYIRIRSAPGHGSCFGVYLPNRPPKRKSP